MRRFAFLLLALGLGAARASAADAERLGRDVVPSFEAVSLQVDAGQARYNGSVEITLRVERPTARFRLHARDMQIDGLTLRAAAGDVVSARHEKVEPDQLAVALEQPLAPGEYRLEIAFSAPFNTKAVALYRMEQAGAAYAFTQFEASDARGAFPCFDEPGFKNPWQLTVKVPEAHLVLSNTKIESEHVEGDWRSVRFAKTKPLPSYLIALAAGPFETVEIPGLGVPGRVVTPRGQAGLAHTAVELTPPLLRALERYFGQPYPFDKLDLIAVPEYWFGAMENPGAITFSDGLLLIDPASTSQAQRSELAKVIAHELAHMWFGDMVTMAWWDDLWLNESFADWMGDRATHEVFPAYRIDLAFIRDAQGVMRGDARHGAAAIHRPVTSTDNLLQDVGVQYAKGKAVLGTVEAWIGPDVFRAGVLRHLKAHAWGSATASDLWASLDAVSGGKVAKPLASFIEQPGLPLVTVAPEAAGRVRLTQSRFSSDGSALAPQTWGIPVTLKYSAGGTAGTRTVLLEGPSLVVDLGAAPDWVYPNGGARGYYRWRVPAAQLARLSGDAAALLSDAERMELVGNLAALSGSGDLEGGRLLAALAALAGDSEPMVVASVLDQLDGLETALVPDELEDAFAGYVRRALRPALDRLGMLPREGESDTAALVRPRLLVWLGDHGRDPDVLSFAERQTEAYLKDSSAVPASIASACLRLSAMKAGPERFDALRGRFEKAQNPAERARYLASLGAFRDPALVDRALEYAFSGPLRPTELFTIPGGVGSTPAGSARAYRWMTENYATLAERLPSEFMGFMPFFAGGCSAERLASAQAFFAAAPHQAKGTERSLERVSAQVGDCLALRKREGDQVRQYLTRPGS